MDFTKEYISLLEQVKTKLRESNSPWSDSIIAATLRRDRAGLMRKINEKKIEEIDLVYLKYKFGKLLNISTNIEVAEEDILDTKKAENKPNSGQQDQSLPPSLSTALKAHRDSLELIETVLKQAFQGRSSKSGSYPTSLPRDREVFLRNTVGKTGKSSTGREAAPKKGKKA
ncbi:MAG: hypothetical protein QM802_20010 [Agriterribacter sp.]